MLLGSGGSFVRRMEENFPCKKCDSQTNGDDQPFMSQCTRSKTAPSGYVLLNSFILQTFLQWVAKMRSCRCEVLAHKEKISICPVLQGLLSFLQHVCSLQGPVSLVFILILYKNINYSHVFHLFTDHMQVVEKGKGKYMVAEITNAVTTWNELDTEKEDPLSVLGGDGFSKEVSLHRESVSHLFFLQLFSLQIFFK